MEIIIKSTVCRLAFIMQPTFSLHLMQRQTTGTTTDDTSTTMMPLRVRLSFIYRRELKLKGTQKTLGAMQRRSEATIRAGCGGLHPGQRLRCTSPSGLPAHCGACGLVRRTFLWEPEAHGGLSESHSVGKSCRERVESMCEKTGS